MKNRAGEFFLKNDLSDNQSSENKISCRRYALSVIFCVVAIGLILIAIFSSSFIDSMISLFVLAVIAVLNAMHYK